MGVTYRRLNKMLKCQPE
jgi:hypothetical protein